MTIIPQQRSFLFISAFALRIVVKKHNATVIHYQLAAIHRSSRPQPFFTIPMSLTASLIQTSIGKKYLSAGSGLLLGFFLLAHLAGNVASFFGPDAYNAYASHLHALGPFLTIPEAILALIFVLHVATGLFLFLENRKAKPCRYAITAPIASRVNSATMPYTGMIILLFVLVHLFQFHFANHALTVSEQVRGTLSQPATGLFYLLSLTALGLHLSHGLWSLLQSFGINHPRYDSFFILSGRGSGILISAVFMLIVILTLLSDTFLL